MATTHLNTRKDGSFRRVCCVNVHTTYAHKEKKNIQEIIAKSLKCMALWSNPESSSTTLSPITKNTAIKCFHVLAAAPMTADREPHAS